MTIIFNQKTYPVIEGLFSENDMSLFALKSLNAPYRKSSPKTLDEWYDNLLFANQNYTTLTTDGLWIKVKYHNYLITQYNMEVLRCMLAIEEIACNDLKEF